MVFHLCRVMERSQEIISQLCLCYWLAVWLLSYDFSFHRTFSVSSKVRLLLLNHSEFIVLLPEYFQPGDVSDVYAVVLCLICLSSQITHAIVTTISSGVPFLFTSPSGESPIYPQTDCVWGAVISERQKSKMLAILMVNDDCLPNRIYNQHGEESLCVSVKNYLNWADWGGKTNFSAAPFVRWAVVLGRTNRRK